MNANRRTWLLLTGALVGALAVALPARPARSCGGFFCNQPQNPNDLPVAQTAENVLFAMDRAPSGQFELTAHIQIFYTGPADRFSWVVPVDSEPKLGVGSNALFTALLQATQPQFQVQWKELGICKDSPAYPPPSVTPPAPPPAQPSPGGAAADAAAGVSIAFRGDVGPYDAAVIKSTDKNDPKPLIDWLNENKYFVGDQATRLIKEYVQLDKYFVAIRLLAEKGVSEIQPLTMKFFGPGPCVPLKLTAIASIRDLRVNLWVLADARVVPDNYFEMELNPARIDWLRGGKNYEDLIKQAADQAGGNAFITEYAGPADLLKGRLFQPGRYNLEGIRQAATPPDALDQIAGMGFSRDNLLLGILRNQIPLPDKLKAMGIDERTFYNQLRFYWTQYRADFKPFNAGALASELDAKIVTPMRESQQLFDDHAKLTRLATFISPEEMNVDPTFVANPSLPDVPVVRTAVATRVCGNRQYDRCTAPVRLEPPGTDAVWLLPKPQPVCYGAAFDYERGQLDALPALYRAWARTSLGEGSPRVDMRPQISDGIRMHNSAAAMAPGSAVAGAPDGGVPPPRPIDGAVWTPDDHGTVDHGGCGCRLGGSAPALPVLALPAAVIAGLLLRRRRPSPPRRSPATKESR